MTENNAERASSKTRKDGISHIYLYLDQAEWNHS